MSVPYPDTQPRLRTLTWDWREQPDLDELCAIIAVLSGGRIEVHEVETGTDEYALVFADGPVTEAQCRAALEAVDEAGCRRGGEVNRPYSEATLGLVTAAIAKWLDGWHGEPEPHRDAAVTALDALAEAGLLLPEGAETRTEWGWDCGHPRAPEKACVHPGVEDWARATAVRVWPGGALVSRWAAETPWRPVDAVRLAEGDTKSALSLSPNTSPNEGAVPVEETPQ